MASNITYNDVLRRFDAFREVLERFEKFDFFDFLVMKNRAPDPEISQNDLGFGPLFAQKLTIFSTRTNFSYFF